MKLKDWLAASDIPDYEFARRIGVSRVTLFRLKKGIRRPTQTVMKLIHDETDGAVTPNDFFNLGAVRSPIEGAAA